MAQQLGNSSGIMHSLGESSFGRGVAAVTATLSLLTIPACAPGTPELKDPETLLHKAANEPDECWCGGEEASAAYAKLSPEKRQEFLVKDLLPKVTRDFGSGIVEIQLPRDFGLKQAISLGDLLSAYKKAHQAELKVTSVAAMSSQIHGDYRANPTDSLLLTVEPIAESGQALK